VYSSAYTWIHVHCLWAVLSVTYDVSQVLNELCPGGGTTTWVHPGVGRNLTSTLVNITALAQIHVSSTRKWFFVLDNGTYHNVPDMDTLNGLAVPAKRVVLLHMPDLELFPEGEPVPHCDPDWDAKRCTETYYYKALHSLD
jgi:hypothetical protein